MDEYDRKFAEMQKYIPFLEAMIERLQNVKDKSREIQLQKMQSLHGILSNSKRKLKIETLQRCEDVLQKLHNKVEKGNTPGLHFPNKKGEGNSAEPVTSTTKSPAVEEMKEGKDIDETPASPSPPVSPDSGSQTEPIIIPTERSVDFTDDKSDSKPASPDQVDSLPTKPPIIIPTERTSDIAGLPSSSKHSINKNPDDVSFSEWDMLEECEKQKGRNKGNWQNIVSSGHEVSSSKLLASNLSQKVNDARSHVPVAPRHIPTVPVPSLGSSRRLASVLEKNRLSALSLDTIGSDSRSDSPVNASDARLKSPDPELLFSKHKSTSPRLKDAHAAAKGTSKPPAPLLLSPPPVSEPPLSMEDLAELLNEENDGKSEKKNEKSGDKGSKFKKDANKQESSAASASSKDAKASKPFLLTQADIDRESERRWEEIDKHIVKLTTRKCLPSIPSTSKVETVKSNEIKGPPMQPGSSVENRPRPPSPNSKPEPRYADNYERHTRPQRDAHRHESIKDKLNSNVHCRLPEDDLASPITVHHGNSNKLDDRNVPLYQRRQASVGPEMVPPRVDTDFRVDGADYFNRPVPNTGHWQQLHPSVNTNDFCNNQWPQPAGFNGMPNPPVPPVSYQHPMGMHQEMWNVPPAGNAIHMDPHQINDPQHRPNQFPGNLNAGIRPLMSPTARPQDINHTSRPDNIRDDLPNVNVPVMQPLMSPTNYPVAPPYRNFQGENRPYDPSFDRGMEYPHVRPTWDAQAGRMNDVPYRGEGEMHGGIIGTEGPVGNTSSYPRPSTPCPWNRDRDRCNRGRGRETYYNDRGRGETRSNFNRDVRRPEWDNCNRFNRDNRNLSERDPRVRMEHNIVITTQSQPRENSSTSVRDPRLAKDKHLTPVKTKEPVYSERDTRKRQPSLLPSPRKVKEKSRSPKSSENQRRSDPENSAKHAQEKALKDKMQSPLESLYGVIDTKAKSAQGYCLQNFKIPKIKRSEPSQSPTPSNVPEEAKPVETKGEREDRPNATEKRQEEKSNKDEAVSQRAKQTAEKEDTPEEVSSSSDGNTLTEDWTGVEATAEKKEDTEAGNTSSEYVEDTEKSHLKIGEADSIMVSSPRPSESTETAKKEDVELEIPKSKDEVTQEWIEALIRKSFEFGEGKKIVEQAKLLQKLGEALQAKKLKKIKKIIESETESSNSDRDEDLESKKIRARKKRRVIVSDSSEEESLAERLGTFAGTTPTTSKKHQEEIATEDSEKQGKKEAEEPLAPVVAVPPKVDDAEERTTISQEPEDTVQKGESRIENLSTETSEPVEQSDAVTPKDTTVKNAEEQGDKEASSKTPKAKSRRRNSLEMLQEDIREMFISEGVVTATGHRMCRIQKENQQNSPATPSAQNSPTVNKKEEALDKRDKETNSDAEQSTAIPTKQKKALRSRSTDETGKTKSKTRNKAQRVTRHRSKQFVQSSDSEEDQPLALRTEIAQNSSSISNQEDDSQRSDDQPDILRRSKRVINKETIKEPRVLVEKTDISKLECSKVMFDSSSDESFGIDVSELAAAVDISLHPEKQAELEVSGDTEASKKKAEQDTSKKPSRKKGNDSVAEEKDEDAISDEESITSDISLSSSVASVRKSVIGRPRSEVGNSEELLSNILVGLVPTKTDAEKCGGATTADKGSDADVDDDTNDQLLSGQRPRKGSTKKKKKKCNWQLGILSKKKKKKVLTSSSPKLDSDLLNTSTETVSSTKTDSSLLSQEKINNEANVACLEDVCEPLTKDPKEDITTDNDKTHSEVSDAVSKKEESTEVIVLQDTSSTQDEPSCNILDSSKKSIEKNENKQATELKKPNDENSLKKGNEAKKKVQYDDLMEKAFRSLDIKSLVDYAWTGQERYKCLLCFFTGKNIVHHYKLTHPGKEILISRLKAEDAQKAIQQADQGKEVDSSQDSILNQSRKFNCRFCYFTIEGAANVALEAFYEHCTTHTGEYRFRCNSCPYQAVAKSSMRTHFYKVCRKVNDVFNEVTSEDQIPKENYIYGYICSNCNYLQLKGASMQQHLDLWHNDEPNVRIVKINMSVDVVKEDAPGTAEEKVKVELPKTVPEKSEVTVEKSGVPETISVQDDIVPREENETVSAETKSNSQKEEKEYVTKNKDQLKTDSSQGETETPTVVGNLSVFVCPPELEKKEVEIQLERKRKMQEVIKNIGIKVNKDANKKGLSIIDKLKDKMKTNLQMGVISHNNEANLADNTSKNTTIVAASSPTLAQSNAMELSETNSNASLAEDTATNSASCWQQASASNSTSISPITDSEQLLQTSEKTAQAAIEVDKLDKKIRDPLSTVTDKKKNYESELEVSDNENVGAPIYESDSSSEQSDSEPPADVSMLLKETSNINSSSKDPMITTIQRLAAQLQAAKPLETCKTEGPSKTEESTEKPSGAAIPKPPNVIPIASIRHFVGKLDKTYQELIAETHDDSYPPKNFIRLRRLSGDMLSIPMPSDGPEGFALTKIDGKDINVPIKTETLLQKDMDEECSFLKIENVVSLAPRAENDSAESVIINDIRKAVETTAVKTKGVSLLKKSNSPFVLKRLNAVAITKPLAKTVSTSQPATSDALKIIPIKSLPPTSSPMSTTQLATSYVPIAPKSKIQLDANKLSFPLSVNKSSVITPVTSRPVTISSSSVQPNLNYKIVKVVRSPTVLKSKETVTSATASKLKSSEVYNAMIKPSKLCHFYKCMARECNFTSDTVLNYNQHYNQHMNETDKKKGNPPYDYQRCAYCYQITEDWSQMKSHLEEKHEHCRYQCSYCFYRAIAPSYVQIHQIISHPGHHGILLGKVLKEAPLVEEINRHDYVHPYICQHDCGKLFYVPQAFAAHLKSKHATAVFKCHVCCVTFSKIEQLLSHYKIHGFHKYQCLYCLNGSDTCNEMYCHLSTFHYNRIPQLLERSLPRQSVRTKDVIDQLVIRRLDENVKNFNEVIEVDGETRDDKDFSKNVIDISGTSIPTLGYSQLTKEITLLDSDQHKVLNAPIQGLLIPIGSASTLNLSSGNVTPSQDEKSSFSKSVDDIASQNNMSSSITDVADILMTSNTHKLSLDPNSSDAPCKKAVSLLSGKIITAREGCQTSKHIHNESELQLSSYSSNQSVDSLQVSGALDCSDEFININLLDNPDFLKGGRCSDTSFANNVSAANENKTEDSDIEILDTIDTIADVENARNTSKISNSDEKSKIDTTALNIATQKGDKNDQQAPSTKTETISTADETSENPSNTTTKPEKPLTLEDIKDTGLSGRKLYICGYESCNFSAQTAAILRAHTKECPLYSNTKNLICFHCSKRFVKIGFLLEHLKVHGLKRFGCSLCKMRCPVPSQAMAHMKTKHKLANSKLVPADPKNPSADGLFIVQPVIPVVDRKGKKRKSMKSGDKDSEKILDVEKLSFTPDEIESLPRQAIYNREVQCAVCPYTTKVRTNIIRHLQLHAKDETVPETGPVNPVPCLDKKERMFDKMVNLASSSHQNGRMGGKPKEIVKNNDDEFIPKFVPEHKRYVCGVAECNYLTVDEAMLRYHLKALHSEEPYFRCPHCPQPQPGQETINVAIDKMGIHLKMHDTRLYKCSHCNHHHYHRHIVERHLTDKHPEKRPFVKVIRELESTENTQQLPQEETEEEVPDPDGNHWKCNMCEYKCVYKAEMISHASTVHDEKCQFKCTVCTFKTSGKIMFEQHMTSKHSNDQHVDYILIYQRIKGVNKKNTEIVEQIGQEEPFDTTPLWRRDMPRIRHIRGILLEEEDNTSATESSLKTTKRKSDAEAVPSKPAKIKPGKSASLDENLRSKEKSKRSLSCEKMPGDVEQSTDVVEAREKPDARLAADKLNTKGEAVGSGDLQDSDVGRFGPYGKPDGNMYVCTLCTQFKSKYKHDMRDHLYRELNYARWHCKECGYLSVNRNALLKHFTKHHQGERPEHEPLSPDDAIEDWVRTLLKNQTCIMRGILPKPTSGVTLAAALDTNASVPLTQTDNIKSRTTSSNNIANKTVKPVNPQQTASTIQDGTAKSAELNVNGADEDSRDNDELVIDIKEDTPGKVEKNESMSELDKERDQEKPLTCKHCKMIFTRWRGFKLHVQLTHLKRLGYLCPYCDRSTNSESLMRQHIRSKHAGCPEKIVQNPAAGGPELTNDFWEREYGIVCPKKSPKKRKRKLSTDDITTDKDGNELSEAHEKCSVCGFVAIGLVGLKAHMRVHAAKNSLKCAHCPFVACVKNELWEHWEDNHPFVPFKVDESSASGSTTESASNQRDSKRLANPYKDDIEEEQVIPVSGSKEDLIYCCFYCSLRSKSLDALRNHWSIVHKDPKLANDPVKSKTSLPFRYKEIRMSLPSPPKQPKRAPYTKTETESPYELYMQQTQSDVSAQIADTLGANQEGWECQWCNELCDTESTMKTHQNLYHSHLPLNFKRKGSNELPKGYICPECPFTTTFINAMKSHVTKHISLFKCKYCSKTFSSPTQVSSHNAEEHPDLEFKIESVQNYDALIENIMAKVKWCKSEEGSGNSLDRAAAVSIGPPKNHAVAKKSTAKPTVRAQPVSCKVKAVARKSTNPFSRYITKTNYKENENHKPSQKVASSKPFSVYGVPKAPINLAKLNTYMVVGGARMKVNCTTLAQLINIDPQVVLTDLKHDIKNIAVLSKLK